MIQGESPSLVRRIPRNLEDQVKILGLTPIELAACAMTYALISPALRGIPFSPLLSLAASGGLAVTLLILNRTHPPAHGLLWILRLFRPRVLPVMGGKEVSKYELH